MKQIYTTLKTALAVAVVLGLGLFQTSTAQETGTMTDIDGNVYKTVKIGDQEWMAENLRVTRFSNGDSIPFAWGYQTWRTTSLLEKKPARAIYAYEAYTMNEDTTIMGPFLETFGFMYNHFVLTDERGVAPAGWKVPDEDDWKTLEKHAGMTEAEVDLEFVAGGFNGWRGTAENVGVKLRSESELDWDYGVTANPMPIFGTNDYGFNWVPGSIRYADGTHEGFSGSNQNDVSAYRLGPIWSLTSSSTVDTLAYRRQANFNFAGVQLRAIPKASGLYVRLVKDPNYTSTEQLQTAPTQFALSQNYPNPFNPSTTISYSLPQASMVNVTVYDMLGREVAVLVNAQLPAGNHTVAFDASQLTSGMYLYRLEAGNVSLTKKMTLIK
jgi:uncharacterized protein (TIGR02145 family)